MNKKLRDRTDYLCSVKIEVSDSDDFCYNHLMEECAELIQAISKLKRLDSDKKKREAAPVIENLLEEMADVQIGIRELYLRMKLKDNSIKKLYNEAVDRKLTKKEKFVENYLLSVS